MTTPAELMSIYSSQSQLSSFFTDKIGIYSIMSYANKKTIYDGITSATTALTNCITACAITGGIVMIPTTENGSTYLLDDDITIPSNVSLWSVSGALLEISSGKTLTINGCIESGAYQMFSGSGLVRGTYNANNIYPEWWGVLGDGVTDDTILFEKANVSLALSGGGVLKCSTKTYMLSNVTIKSEVLIVGNGDSTVLKSIAGNTSHLVTLSNKYSERGGLKDLLLDGNKANQTIAKDVINITETAGEWLYNDAILTFKDLFILNAKGNGMYLSIGIRGTHVNKVTVKGCDGHGYYIEGTDNTFISTSSSNSGKNGYFITGGNNVLIDCKSFYAGEIDSVDFGDGFGLATAIKTKLIGCEAQENGRHGITLKNSATDNLITNFIADTNGRITADSYGYNLTTGTKRCIFTDCSGVQTTILAGTQTYVIGITNDCVDNTFTGTMYAENPESEPIYETENPIPLTNTVTINRERINKRNLLEDYSRMDRTVDGVYVLGYDYSMSANITGSFEYDKILDCQKIAITGGVTAIGSTQIKRKFACVAGDTVSVSVDTKQEAGFTSQIQINYFTGGAYVSNATSTLNTSTEFSKITLVDEVVPASINNYEVVINVVPLVLNNAGDIHVKNIEVITDNYTEPLVGYATHNPISLIDGAIDSANVTVYGAKIGDIVNVSFSQTLQGIFLLPYVSADNVVTVKFQNNTGGTIDLDEGVLKVKVIKS